MSAADQVTCNKCRNVVKSLPYCGMCGEKLQTEIHNVLDNDATVTIEDVEERRLERTTSGKHGPLAPENRGKGTLAHRPIGGGAVAGKITVKLVDRGTGKEIQTKEVQTWDGRFPLNHLASEWMVKNMSLRDGHPIHAAPDGHSIEGFFGIHTLTVLADPL